MMHPLSLQCSNWFWENWQNHAGVHVCLLGHVHAYVHMFKYGCEYVHMVLHVRVCVCVRACVHAHIHIYAYISGRSCRGVKILCALRLRRYFAHKFIVKRTKSIWAFHFYVNKNNHHFCWIMNVLLHWLH